MSASKTLKIQLRTLAKLYSEGEYEKSVSLALQLIRKFPERHALLKLLGLSLYGMKRANESIRILKKASSIAPKDIEVDLILGQIYRESQQYENAETSFKKALDKDMKSVAALKGLAYVLGRQRKNIEAELSYKRAIEIDSNDPELFANLGILLKEKGQLLDAVHYLRKSLHIAPKNSDISLILANALKDNGELEDAESLYLRAIRLEAASPNGNYRLGVLKFEGGDYESALNYFEISGLEKSEDYILRCLDGLKNVSQVAYMLKDRLNSGKTSAVIGAVTNSVNHELGLGIPNSFCNSPVDYVAKVSFGSNKILSPSISNSILNILKSGQVDFRSQSLLVAGQQTAGNIFDAGDPYIGELEKYIHLCINQYRKKFYESDEGMFIRWPGKTHLRGWIVTTNDGGSLGPHYHEDAWVSGCYYLKIPADLNDDEGCLKLSESSREEAMSNNGPDYILNPKAGDLIIFPASMTHHTTPFNSSCDRVVLAFDVVGLSD